MIRAVLSMWATSIICPAADWIPGAVEIECTLATDGTVELAKVKSGHLLLGGAVMKAMARWTFAPKWRESVPSSNVVVLPFDFKLAGMSQGALFPDHFTVESMASMVSH